MATDEHWERVAGAANQGLPYCSCLLELRDRIAALESLDCVSAILKLSRRVDALEAAQNLRQQDEDVERVAADPQPVATDEELQRCYGWAFMEAVQKGDAAPEATELAHRAVYDLGRQHGAAANSKPTPNFDQIRSSAPAGGLLERVCNAMSIYEPIEGNARAAIRAVADWLRSKSGGGSGQYWSQRMEQEAGR
jgi:hypothetical protein